MRVTIVVLIFTALLYSTTQAFDCSNATNSCELSDFYSAKKGYRCLPIDADNVVCTCPGSGYEINQKCRPCNRTNPTDNACNNAASNYITCIESDDYNTAYACLCTNPSGGFVATLDRDCALTHPLTPASSTLASACKKPSPTSLCLNGAYEVSGKCQCVSGYTGQFCQQKFDANVCERINCTNRGVAAIRTPNGPFECVCLCRSGTWGEYCELNGTAGFCGANSCLNNGACKENLIATTRFAYCACQPGYNGTRCENNYFTCTVPGLFPDEAMKNQGKYFECKTVGSSLQAVRQSCPKGLHFDTNAQCCIV